MIEAQFDNIVNLLVKFKTAVKENPHISNSSTVSCGVSLFLTRSNTDNSGSTTALHNQCTPLKCFVFLKLSLV